MPALTEPFRRFPTVARLSGSIKMKLFTLSNLAICLCLLTGCKKSSSVYDTGRENDTNPSKDGKQEPSNGQTLVEARRGFQTKLTKKVTQDDKVPEPPPALFQIVRYDSPVGKLPAYLSTRPKDDKKHPAIIWIFGGFGNDIGDPAWKPAQPQNDQSASAFRKAGIVMMYPALRGGHEKLGFQESFYGEVDDVLAAAAFLAKQDFVDPERIYLGGHSTGGTLVLLAAECSDRFRAVFSFGPTEDVRNYGHQALNFDFSNQREAQLRAPGRWLHCIKTPVFVFEGEQGNIDSLQMLAHNQKNPLVQLFPVIGADHFSVLAPLTRLCAEKVLADSGLTCSIRFSKAEIEGAMRK